MKWVSLWLLTLSLHSLAVVTLPSNSDALRSQPWPFGTALRGSYVSMVKIDNMYYYFSEKSPDNKTSGLNLYGGKDEKRPKYLGVIAPREMISDVLDNGQLAKNRLFTRLSVQFSNKEQRLYAIANVSDGYPSADGQVLPSLWYSNSADPKGGWSYVGKFGGGGDLKNLKGAFSGMTFILNDNHDPVVNHSDPLKNKFVYYIDYVHPGGRGLSIMYSLDGSNWHFHKDSSGKIIDLRPKQFSADAIWTFTSGVKTPVGYFMMATLGWPAEKHRLLYSSNGIDWIEAASTSGKKFANHSEPKNIGLSYEPKSNMISFLITQSAKSRQHVKHLAKMSPSSLVPTLLPSRLISPRVIPNIGGGKSFKKNVNKR